MSVSLLLLLLLLLSAPSLECTGVFVFINRFNTSVLLLVPLSCCVHLSSPCVLDNLTSQLFLFSRFTSLIYSKLVWWFLSCFPLVALQPIVSASTKE